MSEGRTAAPRLEQRLERLEALVAALEAEDLELDEALRLFEEGVAHVRAARDLLRRAELKVEELVEADADGSAAASGPVSPAEADAPGPAPVAEQTGPRRGGERTGP